MRRPYPKSSSRSCGGRLEKNLETRHPGLYVIGDGSGVTHSLSHASASGVFVARDILAKM